MSVGTDNGGGALLNPLGLVTGVIINDAEARELAGKVNLIEAGEGILQLGPSFVIIKKGEHGALLVTPDGPTAIPAFPTKAVCDPTGAGDSFAGGVLGYLCAQHKDDPETLRRAMVRGTVAASFAIEGFSLGAVKNLTRPQIDDRVDRLLKRAKFALTRRSRSPSPTG